MPTYSLKDNCIMLSVYKLGLLSGLPQRIHCPNAVTYVVHQSAKDFLDEAVGSILSVEIQQAHHDLFARSIQVLHNRDTYGLQHPGSRPV
jgi:hypothetical protein